MNKFSKMVLVGMVLSTSVQAQARTVGNWTLRSSYNDYASTRILSMSTLEPRWISISCNVRYSYDYNLTLLVNHSFLMSDVNNQVDVEIKIGNLPTEQLVGLMLSDGGATSIDLSWKHVEALKESPNIYVKVKEAVEGSTNSYTINRRNLVGTTQAINTMLSACNPNK